MSLRVDYEICANKYKKKLFYAIGTYTDENL